MSTLKTPTQGLFDQTVNQALAHWHVEPDMWTKFLKFDKAKRHKHDALTLVVILVIVVVLLSVLLLIGALDALVAVLIVAAILGVAVVVHFPLQGDRYQKMHSGENGSGDVYITPNGIWSNGVWFHWGDDTPWKLITVTPVLSNMGVRLPPGVPSYVEFRCRGRTVGRPRARIEKMWRVPVPRGKEDDALNVFNYFGKPSARRNEFGLPDD